MPNTFKLSTGYIHKTIDGVHQTRSELLRNGAEYSAIFFLCKISSYQVCHGFGWQLGMSTTEVFL